LSMLGPFRTFPLAIILLTGRPLAAAFGSWPPPTCG
jgi:hypothetical protein